MFTRAGSNRTSQISGKERDETGFDYFGARYFSGAIGRFTSPDPKASSAHRVDPQSWNRYTYTLNNPLKYVDPNGMDAVLAEGMSERDRKYVVENLARLYSTPAGKAMLQRVDESRFTVTIGTGDLSQTDSKKASSGATVLGSHTSELESGRTEYASATYEGHTLLVAESNDSPGAPPIEVIIDRRKINIKYDDPAKVLGHELGGHTADILNEVESQLEPYIDNYDPNDETSSEKAEKSIGKMKRKVNPEDIEAVEELLKKRVW